MAETAPADAVPVAEPAPAVEPAQPEQPADDVEEVPRPPQPDPPQVNKLKRYSTTHSGKFRYTHRHKCAQHAYSNTHSDTHPLACSPYIHKFQTQKRKTVPLLNLLILSFMHLYSSSRLVRHRHEHRLGIHSLTSVTHTLTQSQSLTHSL